MSKKIIFSKKYENFDIKSSFYNKNNFYLNNSKKVNNIYSKQIKRKKCKNCNYNLLGISFESFKIKYIICKKCNHLNGIHEDSNQFVNFLYTEKGGKNYFKNYFNDFDKRVSSIYLPKVQFLKNTLKNNKIEVLDIGSGAGHLLKSFELKNISAIGYEPNKILCELAQKKLKKNKIYNINLTDIYEIVENSNRNCLSLIGVLEHLKDPHKLLKSFCKYLLN